MMDKKPQNLFNKKQNKNQGKKQNKNAAAQAENPNKAANENGGKNAAKQNRRRKNYSAGKPRQDKANFAADTQNAEAQRGGKNIVTKRPVWAQASAPKKQENRTDNRTGTTKRAPQEPQAHSAGGRVNNLDYSVSKAVQRTRLPEAPKNDKEIFDFSEDELKKDTAIKVVSRSTDGEIKYANFEEYLEKTQNNN